MITQTNVYFGATKPEEYMLESDGIRVNTNIREDTIDELTGWFATSSFILKDDDAYLQYKRTIDLQTEITDQDVLTVESIEGTISDTSKARLYARLVHDGKKTWPTDVPSELRSATYDAYANHYKFTPAINPPANILSQAFTITGGVCDTTMYLTSIDGLTASGTVTVSSGENKAYINYTAISGTTLTGCTCSSGDDAVYPIGAEIEQA